MILDFKEMTQTGLDNFKGGEGKIFAKMFFDGKVKIMDSTMPPHTSIGKHTHTTSCEIVYALKGQATIIEDGKSIILKAGQVHYCPKGSTHEIRNDSEEDFHSFNVVPEC